MLPEFLHRLSSGIRYERYQAYGKYLEKVHFHQKSYPPTTNKRINQIANELAPEYPLRVLLEFRNSLRNESPKTFAKILALSHSLLKGQVDEKHVKLNAPIWEPHGSSLTTVATLVSTYVNKQLDVVVDTSTYVAFISSLVAFVSACVLVSITDKTSSIAKTTIFLLIASSLVALLSSMVGMIAAILKKQRVKGVKKITSNLYTIVSNLKIDDELSLGERILEEINRSPDDITVGNFTRFVNDTANNIIADDVKNNPTVPTLKNAAIRLASPLVVAASLPIVTRNEVTIPLLAVATSAPTVTTVTSSSYISSPPPVTSVIPPHPISIPNCKFGPMKSSVNVVTTPSLLVSMPSIVPSTISTIVRPFNFQFMHPGNTSIFTREVSEIKGGLVVPGVYGFGTHMYNIGSPRRTFHTGVRSCLPDALLTYLDRGHLDLYEKFHLLPNACQDTDFLASSALAMNYNYIILDVDDNILEYSHVTQEMENHNTCILRYSTNHFDLISLGTFTPCNDKCCFTALKPLRVSHDQAVLQGGLPRLEDNDKMSSVIRGSLAIMIAMGASAATAANINLSSAKNLLAVFNSGANFSGNIADFGAKTVRTMFNLTTEREEKDKSIINSFTRYAVNLIATVNTDVACTPSLVQEHVHFPLLMQRVTEVVTITPSIIPLIANLRSMATTIINKVPSMTSALSSMHDRPPTVFFQLFGPEGVGKSYLATQIANELLVELNLPEGIFNSRINSDGYFNTYAGQRAGITEEFLMNGAGDEMIMKINHIGSGTAFNMPAAFEKYQYCQLLFNILTSNTERVNLQGKVSTVAARAIWSRITAIEMAWKDKDFSICSKNRHDTSFRASDWSHVQFTLREHAYDKIAHKEVVEETRLDYPALKALFREKIRTISRNDIFTQKTKASKAVEQSRKQFDDLLADYPNVLEWKPHSKSTAPAGTSHIFCMLSGPAGTGKTTSMNTQVLPALKFAYPLLPQRTFSSRIDLENFLEKPCILPIVAYFDDVITSEQSLVQQVITKLPNPSIVLHTANLREKNDTSLVESMKFHAKNTFIACTQYQYTDKNQVKRWESVHSTKDTYSTCLLTEGLVRRSGLTGRIRAGNVTFMADSHVSIWYQTILSGTSGVLRKARFPEERLYLNLVTDIMEKYTSIRESGGIFRTIPYIDPPKFDVINASISLSSYEELNTFVMNPLKYRNHMYYDTEPVDKDIYIFLDNATTAAYGGDIPPGISATEVVDSNRLQEIVSFFLHSLWRKDNNLKVKIQIGTDIIYAAEGKIFIPRTSGFDVIIDESKDKVSISYLNTQEVGSLKGLMKVLENGYSEGKNLSSFDMFILSNIQEFNAHAQVQALRTQNIVNRTQRVQDANLMLKLGKFSSWIKTNKATAAIIGIAVALLTVFTLGGIGYGIFRLVHASRKKEPLAPKIKTAFDKVVSALPVVPPVIPIISQVDIPSNAAQHGSLPAVSEGGAMMDKQRRLPATIDPVWRQHGKATQIANQLRSISTNIVTYVCTNRTAYAFMLTSTVGVTNAHLFGEAMTVIKDGKSVPIIKCVVSEFKDILIFQTSSEVPGCRTLNSRLLHPTCLPDLQNVQLVKKNHTRINLNVNFNAAANVIPSMYNGQLKKFTEVFIASHVEDQLGPGDCGLPTVSINHVTGLISVVGVYAGTIGGYPAIATVDTSSPRYMESHADETVYCFSTGTRNFTVLDEEKQLITNASRSTCLDLPMTMGTFGKIRSGLIPVRTKRVPSPFVSCLDEPIFKTPATVYMTDVAGPYHVRKIYDLATYDWKYSQLSTLISMQAPNTVDIDVDILEASVFKLASHYQSIYGTHGSKLTDVQVLSGYRGNHKLRGCLGNLNLDAGSGLIQANAKAPLKNHLFSKNEEGFVITRGSDVAKRTWDRFELASRLIEKGTAVNFIALDSLKSELLPLEKARVGKIRLYQAAAIEEVLLIRKYFGNFMARAVKNHSRAHNQLGLNVFTDFDVIAKRLLQTSKVGEDGDYKNYDKSLPAVLMSAACTVVNACYDDDLDYVRTSLVETLTNALHCADGNLYVTSQGNPSGQAATSLLNGVCNDLLQVYCYYKCREINPSLPESFTDAIDWVCSGDDSITFTKDIYQSLYTFEFKQSVLKHDFGMDYTSPVKILGDKYTNRPLEDLSFCSHRFVKLGSYYYGSLKHESLMSVLQWTSSLTSIQLADNLAAFLYGASCCSNEDFEKYFSYAENILKNHPQVRLALRIPFQKTYIRALGYRLMRSKLNLVDYENDCTLEPNVSQKLALITSDYISHVQSKGTKKVIIYSIENPEEYIHLVMDPVSRVNSITQLIDADQCTYMYTPGKTEGHYSCTASWGSLLITSSVTLGKKKCKQEVATLLLKELYNIPLLLHDATIDALADEITTIKIDHDVAGDFEAVVISGNNLVISKGNGTSPRNAAEKALNVSMTPSLFEAHAGVPPQSGVSIETPVAEVSSNAFPLGATDTLIMGHVPSVLAVTSGIEPDLKAKAYATWTQLARTTTDSTQVYGNKLISRAMYPYSFLSGWGKLWADQHEILTGGVDVNITIQGQPASKGTIIFALVKEDKTVYSSRDLEELGYQQEISVAGFTEKNFTVNFTDKMQPGDSAHWYNSKTRVTSDDFRYFVIITGNRPVGLAMGDENTTTIDIVIKTRLSEGFVATTARYPLLSVDDAKTAGMSRNEFGDLVGETFGSVIGINDVYLSTDGSNPDTSPYSSSAFAVDPDQSQGVTIAPWPMNGNLYRVGESLRSYYLPSAFLMYEVQDGLINQADFENFPRSDFITWNRLLNSNTLSSQELSPTVLYAKNTLGELVAMDSAFKTFPSTGTTRFTFYPVFVFGRKLKIEESLVPVGQPIQSGTASISLQYENREQENYAGSYDVYLHQDGDQSCVFVSNTPLVTRPMTTEEGRKHYVNGVDMGKDTRIPGVMNEVRNALTYLEIKDQLVTFSAGADINYPLSSYRRAGLTLHPAPPTTIKSGRPTVLREPRIMDPIDLWRQKLSPDTAWVCSLADPRLHINVATLVFPSDLSLAPYVIVKSSIPLYGAINYNLADYLITESKVVAQGIPVRNIISDAFTNRMVRNVAAGAPVEFHPHALIGAVLVGTAAGALGQIGNSAFNQQFQKEMASMVNDYKVSSREDQQAFLREMQESGFRNNMKSTAMTAGVWSLAQRAKTNIDATAEAKKQSLYGPGTIYGYNSGQGKTATSGSTVDVPEGQKVPKLHYGPKKGPSDISESHSNMIADTQNWYDEIGLRMKERDAAPRPTAQGFSIRPANPGRPSFEVDAKAPVASVGTPIAFVKDESLLKNGNVNSKPPVVQLDTIADLDQHRLDTYVVPAQDTSSTPATPAYVAPEDRAIIKPRGIRTVPVTTPATSVGDDQAENETFV